MSRVSLARGAPAGWRALPALYVLGVGGPESGAGIGDVSAFAWRCALLRLAREPDCLLLFSAMPKLMAATRAVNGRAPFSLPTEALRVAPADLGAAPVQAWLDPSPEALLALPALQIVERKIPELFP